MAARHGSFLAVLVGGRHITMTGVFSTAAEFHAWVTEQTALAPRCVIHFVYAYGSECQEYTPSEFLSEYHEK